MNEHIIVNLRMSGHSQPDTITSKKDSIYMY